MNVALLLLCFNHDGTVGDADQARPLFRDYTPVQALYKSSYVRPNLVVILVGKRVYSQQLSYRYLSSDCLRSDHICSERTETGNVSLVYRYPKNLQALESYQSIMNPS